jgi:hypothetical protein
MKKDNQALKDAMTAELIGIEHLLSITPDDPLATPALEGRKAELEALIERLQGLLK